MRLDSKNFLYFLNRGIVHSQKADYDSAIADFDEAIRLDQNVPEIFAERGAAYAMKGRYDQAIADYDKSIQLDSNFAEAITLRAEAVAKKNESGAQISGEATDDAAALSRYHKAADQGNARAQYNLGLMYENGRGGLPKDDRAALIWYRRSADQGNASAQCNIGFMYEKGRYLFQDDHAALTWYQKAADQGYARAQGVLGIFHERGRGGLPRDDAAAASWYCKAAEQGDALAQHNLGVFYEQGRGGLPKDDREAARLFKLAADQGDAGAGAALARLQREREREEHEAAARERQRRQEEQKREREEHEAAARERQRRQGERNRRSDAASSKMNDVAALEILGLKAGATEEEISAAYTRLMKRVHPDVGGSDFFAKQLNDARDVLLATSRLDLGTAPPQQAASKMSNLNKLFDFGKYKLDQKVTDFTGLKEFSFFKSIIIGRNFKGQKNYDGPSVIFLGRSWELMLGTVHGQIFKIAATNSPSTKHEANVIAMEALRYCKERLGQPSEQTNLLYIWDTEDGNVVLHNKERLGMFNVAIFLTSAAVRQFELL